MYFLSVSAVAARLLQRSRLPLAGCCRCMVWSGLDRNFAVLAAAGPQHFGTATFCTHNACATESRWQLAAPLSQALHGGVGCQAARGWNEEEEEEQTEEGMIWRRVL